MYARKLFLMLGWLAVVGLALVTAAPSHANGIAPTPMENKIPVAALLKQDGTLDLQKGVTGALDLAGWNVALDPQRGPVLASNSPTATGWAGLSHGLDSSVTAIAVNGKDVYVGGFFTQICANTNCDSKSSTMNHIAKWNGSAWSSVGHGVNGIVLAIAVSADGIIAGGQFTRVCAAANCLAFNTRVNHIAYWNGSVWSALGKGFNQNVDALTLGSGLGGPIYAGGSFTEACGNVSCDKDNVTVNHIAQFTSGGWVSLAHGFNGYVTSLREKNGNLYAAGGFNWNCSFDNCTAGPRMNYIAEWNGANWSAVGNGMDKSIWGIVFLGNDLYAGGSFTHLCGNAACNSGNVAVNYIARWDGTHWHAVANGVSAAVKSLAATSTDVIVGGDFTEICGVGACNFSNKTVNHIARWNGSQWTALQGGTDATVQALAVQKDQVIAGGEFWMVCADAKCIDGAKRVSYVAKYTSPACSAKPAAPTLVTPANNAQVSKQKVNLSWNDVPCATSYQVLVKQDTNNGATVFQTTVNVSQTKTTALPKGHTYFWRAQACNAAGCAKSTWFAFTIQP